MIEYNDNGTPISETYDTDKFIEQTYGNSPDKSYREKVDGKDNAVNHPSHYTSGKFEVIDIIEDQLGIQGLVDFCFGNTIKYICRAGKKDKNKTLEDLEKAEWYLHHAIQRLKDHQEWKL